MPCGETGFACRTASWVYRLEDFPNVEGPGGGRQTAPGCGPTMKELDMPKITPHDDHTDIPAPGDATRFDDWDRDERFFWGTQRGTETASRHCGVPGPRRHRRQALEIFVSAAWTAVVAISMRLRPGDCPRSVAAADELETLSDPSR